MGVRHVRAAEIPRDRSAIEGEGFTATFGEVIAAAASPAAWHHHGGHHIVAYLIDGKVRVEFGADGSDTVVLEPGDMVHIEPNTIHRERYVGDVKLVGFSVGEGPGRVDVDQPA